MGKGVRWWQGLIQGAIDIVHGGRLSQIPLRDGVAMCLLDEGRRVISRKCFLLRRRICRPSKILDRMPQWPVDPTCRFELNPGWMVRVIGSNPEVVVCSPYFSFQSLIKTCNWYFSLILTLNLMILFWNFILNCPLSSNLCYPKVMYYYLDLVHIA